MVTRPNFGANGGTELDHLDQQELALLKGKRVIIATIDGNRCAIYVSKAFASQITERDVKTIAGQVQTTLRVVAAQTGNILK